MHIQKAKENAGFHKSAAVSCLRAEVARRKREISSLEEGGKTNTDREMEEREEETERKREWHVIMESRVRRAVCNPSINCQLPNFVSLIHSFLLPLYLPPLCLSPCICHKSGGSKTVGCEK